MKLKFDISATEFVMVRDILVEIIPPGCRVWVFGSRAKNQTRCNSDLDLALEHKDKLPPSTLHKLKEAFNDSLLPYRLDVLDINDVSENFQTIIRQQAIAFLLAKSNKVPKLRFKDAQGNAFPELRRNQLGKIFDYKNGGAFESHLVDVGKYYLITLNSIDIDGNLKLDHKTVDVADWYLEKNDLIMVLSDVAHGNFLGLVDLIPENNRYVLNQRMGLLRKKENEHVTRYIRYYINFNQKYFKKHGQGSSQQNLSKDDVQKFMLPLPEKEEQQKIAGFLASIDTKIMQVAKKKSLLEDYKKGCMQQLFSQKLRFRDEQGNAFPEWEEKRLGDLGKFSGGGTPDTMNADYWNGQIPWVSSSDICDGDLSGPIITRWISEAAINGSATKIVPANSVLIVSRVGVGKLTVSRQEICTSQDFSNFTPRTDNVLFLGYWLLNSSSNLLRLCQGTSIKGLTSDGLKALTLLTPAIPEQKKIADFLCAIDRKIDLITTELEHIRIFKKGLMQQMFV